MSLDLYSGDYEARVHGRDSDGGEAAAGPGRGERDGKGGGFRAPGASAEEEHRGYPLREEKRREEERSGAERSRASRGRERERGRENDLYACIRVRQLSFSCVVEGWAHPSLLLAEQTRMRRTGDEAPPLAHQH